MHTRHTSNMDATTTGRKRSKWPKLLLVTTAFSMILALVASSVSSAADADSSMITVRARGAVGAEYIDLRINGEVVAEWRNISTEYSDYTYAVTEGVTVNALRVNFNNSDPRATSSRSVDIDYVDIDGTKFESEASTTRSFGSWASSNGCQAGYKSSEKLSCDGYFDYKAAFGTVLSDGSGNTTPLSTNPSEGSGSITVRAKGTIGEEDIRLDINGSPVASWDGLSTSYTDYVYNVTTETEINSIRVYFTNDEVGASFDRNVSIDYIKIGDERFESEASTTASEGTWDANGCSPGYKKSEWLDCFGGYFDYEAARGTIIKPGTANPTRQVTAATAPTTSPTTTPTTSPKTTAPPTTMPTTKAPDATNAPIVVQPPSVGNSDYNSNLSLLRSASVRNRNHDNSPYANTPSAQLPVNNLYGPRSDYLTRYAGNPENSFPVSTGGQFRTACEFSHFSYDDPLVYPNKPGAAHLHMHFGNTDVNAFSTYETLMNSGSSTCNGQELNRTGYWVPAMFDGSGNVRVPERIVIYYKGEGEANGKSNVYPEGAAMVTKTDVNNLSVGQDGSTAGKFSFVCSDNFSGASSPAGNEMPACDGSRFKKMYGVDDNPRVVLEMNVKFPQCWNGQDAGNPDNFGLPNGAWYGSYCQGEFNQTFPNLEYFVNYKVDIGENTSDWYLSSDVDPTSFGTSKARAGSTIHGDWWGGWHKETNKMFIDNCVNYRSSSASGCGFGYLTDGGPDSSNPYDGPALKMRPQYTGAYKVPATQLHQQLCPKPRQQPNRPEDAAYCQPGTGY